MTGCDLGEMGRGQVSKTVLRLRAGVSEKQFAQADREGSYGHKCKLQFKLQLPPGFLRRVPRRGQPLLLQCPLSLPHAPAAAVTAVHLTLTRRVSSS